MAVENPFVGDHYHFVERPTPQRLNTELRQLFAQLPYSPLQRYINTPRDLREPTGEFVDELMLGLARRAGSETLTLLTGRLRILLLHAPITYSFRQFILDEFSFSYQSGIDQQNLSDLRIAWILDQDDPASGGIFEPKKVEDFERKGYKQLVDFRPVNERLLQAVFGQENLDEHLKAKKEKGIQSDREKLLVQWREEFSERYGEEPEAASTT